MRVSRVIVSVLLVAAAASLLRAVVTRHGVGPLEYLTSALLIVLLIRFAVGAMRSARHA